MRPLREIPAAHPADMKIGFLVDIAAARTWHTFNRPLLSSEGVDPYGGNHLLHSEGKSERLFPLEKTCLKTPEAESGLKYSGGEGASQVSIRKES